MLNVYNEKGKLNMIIEEEDSNIKEDEDKEGLKVSVKKDKRMEKSVLDMRNKEKKEILRIEEGVWRLLREIINEKGFVEIKKKKII